VSAIRAHPVTLSLSKDRRVLFPRHIILIYP
jgi:hypothetical protein